MNSKRSSKSNSKKSRNAGYGKLFGLLLAGFILALLFFSVPAKAFAIDLSLSQSNVEVGQKVVFSASVDINSADSQISKLKLQLDGNTDYFCEFNVDGVIISGCSGMTIKANNVLSTELTNYGYSYGYGYAYGYKKLSYQITLDTDGYKTGKYATKLNAYSQTGSYSQDGDDLTIVSQSASSSNEDYFTSKSESKVCLNGWKCTDWTSCSDGLQSRTCEMLPNCFLENMPIEQRACVDGPTYDLSKATIKLFNGDSSALFIGSSLGANTQETLKQLDQVTYSLMNYSIQEDDSLMILLIVIVAFIVILLGIIIAFYIFRAIRRSRIRKIRRARRRHLEKIRYRPVK